MGSSLPILPDALDEKPVAGDNDAVFRGMMLINVDGVN
jgi:hypothetical protein